MQLNNLLTSLLLAATASAAAMDMNGMNMAKDTNGTEAHGNGKGGNSVKSQCRSIAKWEAATKLAANDTALAKHFDNNQTAIDAFKTKAADEQTKLTAAQANSTLMDTCNTMFAAAKTVGECAAMKRMEKMVAMAANDTKLTDKFNGNETKIQDFKTKAADAQTKLTSLQSNTTLTTICSVEDTKAECKVMNKLQKEVKLAGNDTALNDHFKGNETMISNFKAMASKMQTKLDALMANTTLMDTCNSLSKASTDKASSSSSTDNASKKSPASKIQIGGGAFTSAAFIVTLGMLLM